VRLSRALAAAIEKLLLTASGNISDHDLSPAPLYCAVSVQTLDAQTRDEMAINELLRE
jgi:tetrahydrodipicolinate N-succinyltransferase